ncbi:MAG: Vacuolar protein sorting-associated protein 62 [bacterium]
MLEFGVPALVVGFVIGLIAGGLIVYSLQKTNILGGKPAAPQRAASSEVAAPMARDLAERFRPRLLFDSLERWRPLNVARMFDEQVDGKPAHRLCGAQGESTCRPIAGEAAFTTLVHEGSAFGGGQYLDLAGRALGDYKGPGTCKQQLLDCGTAPGSAIYYHVTRSNDRYYVDFWWYFRFNNFYKTDPGRVCRHQALITSSVCDEHEGDWEGVTVVTPPDSTDTLDYVVFAAHRGTFRYAASELGLKGGTRANVFLARGSHAAYPKVCARKTCAQPGALAAGGVAKLPEGRFDGRSPWERNDEDCHADVPTSCLLALPRNDADPRAWTVWGGQWGAGCQDACKGLKALNSPRSPGVQQRYQTPNCSLQGAAQTCDGKALGCSDWLGPLVAVVACNPGVVSKALRSTSEGKTGALKVAIAGRPSLDESTPGIVQALGDPLAPDSTITVSGGSAQTQVLVRAQRGEQIVEARFGKLGLGSGRSAVLKVRSAGSYDDVVRLVVPGMPSRAPDELRVVRTQPASAR